MSMEAMLDQERRDVLALLEGHAPARQFNTSPSDARSSSPYNTPRSPVRSMLDVGDDSASITSANGKKSPPRTNALPVRSMLDIDSPPPPPQPRRSMLDIDTPKMAQVPSGPSSPVESRSSVQSTGKHHPRSFSDTNSNPNFGPRASVGDRNDPTAGYQFGDILTNNMGSAMPKRNTQAGKLPAHNTGGPGVMGDVMRGNDLSSIILPGDRSHRHSSFSGPSGRRSSSRGPGGKSKSPHGRGWRSPSPNVSLNLQPIPGQAVLDDGRVVDITNAYRKLSDANMAFAGGRLGELATRKRSSASEGASGGRLAKNYFSPDGEDLGDSSDDDGGDESSSDENSRGRKMVPRGQERKGSQASDSAKPDRQSLSLLAAAEEERIEVSSKQKQPGYRSLFDEPEITVTGPGGEKAKHSKPGVHPSTAFDLSPSSGPASLMDSDEEEDLSDIKRAQKLEFSATPILSTPDAHRTLRIVYRGDYAELRQKAEDEGRRLRKYMVATDLSEESSHALEWTIGTVLRDGDTLLAIYCVDEETGIYSSDDILVPDDAKAHKEQAAAINAVTNSKDTPPPPSATAPMFPHLSRASALGFGSRSSSPAPSNRNKDRAEEERNRAVDEITEKVNKLLRKTKLQVRVIVEVLHCKNPKHLITEIIDLVSPTLVILGSRGRSALKGYVLSADVTGTQC
jgi:nucleotide-binding universal stress UspA family protein